VATWGKKGSGLLLFTSLTRDEQGKRGPFSNWRPLSLEKWPFGVFFEKWLVFQKHKKTLFFNRRKIPRASLRRKNFGEWV